jgi:hypothetical protein
MSPVGYNPGYATRPVAIDNHEIRIGADLNNTQRAFPVTVALAI